MLIEVDKETLKTIFACSRRAARLTEYIHNTMVGEAIAKSAGEICDVVASILQMRYDYSGPAENPTQDSEPKLSIANIVDNLRKLIAKADALAKAAESFLESVVWVEIVGDRRRLEHLAHLIVATSETVEEAIVVGDTLGIELATRGTEE